MIITHVLFDLDGTLIDTAPEIADAVNSALQRHGLPQVGLEQVREWIGHGARNLVDSAVAHHTGAEPDDAQADAVWKDFELDYLEACGTSSRPYPGVREALDRLHDQGRLLAVLTNKEAAFTHKLLVRHELSPYFDLIVAGDTLPVRKPDPQVVLHVLHTMDAEQEDALLVGDSAVDVQLARNAGVAVWCVDYGYHHGELQGEHAPDRLIESIEEVAELPQRIAIV